MQKRKMNRDYMLGSLDGGIASAAWVMIAYVRHLENLSNRDAHNQEGSYYENHSKSKFLKMPGSNEYINQFE